MDEQVAVTKKLEELRKHIPLLESHINTTQSQRNPKFKNQYDKLAHLKDLLTSGRFVSNDEITLKNVNGPFIKKPSTVIYFFLSYFRKLPLKMLEKIEDVINKLPSIKHRVSKS